MSSSPSAVILGCWSTQIYQSTEGNNAAALKMKQRAKRKGSRQPRSRPGRAGNEPLSSAGTTGSNLLHNSHLPSGEVQMRPAGLERETRADGRRNGRSPPHGKEIYR